MGEIDWRVDGPEVGDPGSGVGEGGGEVAFRRSREVRTGGGGAKGSR